MGVALNIMAAIATELKAGLNPVPMQVVAGMNTEPSEPCIDVYPHVEGLEEIDERGFDGAGALVFTVRARVASVDFEGGQDFLVNWMDPYNAAGVDAVLSDDQTLTGLTTSVDVGQVSGFIRYIDTNGVISRLGAEWRVRVLPAIS